jgi:hypothetical protein
VKHNETITPPSALLVLVDCKPDEKKDGLATWAGSQARPRAVRIFNEQDREKMKPQMGERLLNLKLLLAATRAGDKAKIAEYQEKLIGIIDSENAEIDMGAPVIDQKQSQEWTRLMTELGVNPDPNWRYGRRDRIRKLYSFLGTRFFRYFGLKEPKYWPPPVGRRGSRERERRKKYDKAFKRRVRSQERKLEEILAGERLAPVLENEINLSDWQTSRALNGTRLVGWHQEGRFQLALYCGEDLKTAYYAYALTKDFVFVHPTQSLCPFCRKLFPKEGKKKYCTRAHQIADAERQYRVRLEERLTSNVKMMILRLRKRIEAERNAKDRIEGSEKAVT